SAIRGPVPFIQRTMSQPLVSLEGLIILELARTPKAPAVKGDITPSRALAMAGKLLAQSFQARIPDRDQPVCVLSILDRLAVYTFEPDGWGTRLVIPIVYVFPLEDVRWLQGKPQPSWNDSLGL